MLAAAYLGTQTNHHEWRMNAVIIDSHYTTTLIIIILKFRLDLQ